MFAMAWPTRAVAPLRPGALIREGSAMYQMTCLWSAKTAVAALLIAGAAAAMPDRIAAAETSMQLRSCTTMLGVVGVTADDVLFL